MERVTWGHLARALVQPPRRIAEDVSSRAAVAVIFREGEVGLELLFIRRAEHPDDPWSGQMAFPGGRAEPGETDLVRTAVRETAEEVGLDLEHGAVPLGGLDEIRATARGRALDLSVHPFVFRLQAGEADPGDEVESVHWISLDALLGPAFRSTLEYVHDGRILELPCLRVEGCVIWGLTYRMFLNLESALHDALGTGATAVDQTG